jgi:hypothetical protein
MVNFALFAVPAPKQELLVGCQSLADKIDNQSTSSTKPVILLDCWINFSAPSLAALPKGSHAFMMATRRMLVHSQRV